MPGYVNTTSMINTKSVSSGSLGVTGTSTLSNVTASGSLGVTGNSTLSNVTASGTLGVTGDVTVSGNIYGNVITVASVANSTGLVPYGQYEPDSQDVFYAVNTNSVSYPPVHFEHEYNISIPIFTSNAKTTYVNNGTTYPSDPTALLMEYLTNNVYAPSFTSLNNASINSVYANVYSNANQTYGVTTHFSNQPLTAPMTLGFTESDINRLTSNGFNFLTDRGYSIAPPDFNVNYKNMFIGSLKDTVSTTVGGGGCNFSIEFGYGANLNIPSNVYLTAYNFDNIGTFQTYTNQFYTGFLSAYNALAITNSNLFIQPTVIPVTINPSVFSNAYGTSTGKSALYDPTTSQIHIYFNGSSNTYGSGNTIPTFATGTGTSTITWNEVCELSHFEGSFAINKKRAQITTSDRPFVMTNSADPEAFLVQTSNNLIVTSNVYRNGTKIFPSASQATSYGFYSATVTSPMFNGANYSGALIGKVGNGTSNYDVFSFNLSAASAFENSQPAVLLLEKNPYSEITSYYPLPSLVAFYNSNVFSNWFLSTTYANVYTDTPEMLVSNMNSILTYDSVNGMEMIIAHELVHGVIDAGVGVINIARSMMNTEGTATGMEMSYVKKFSKLFDQPLRNVFWAPYMNTSSRGAYPIHKLRMAFEGELHTLGATQNRVQGIFAGSYGESMLFNYISTHHDMNNQVLRRFDDLLQNKLKEGFLDAGFPTWANMFGKSIKASHLVLDTTIQEVTAAQGTPTTLANVYTEFVVAQTMMRNNSTIPDKYKTLYPYWVLNRDAPWSSNLNMSFWMSTNGSTPSDTIFWSDAIDGIPIGTTPVAASGGDNWAIGGTQNDTLVPIWPKEGSFATSKPFSNGPVKNNLGSWANAITRNAWTYTSNTYINTPLVHQLEDMASFTYVIPTFSNVASNVYGTSHYVSNIAVVVTRGDWVFKVVQFVPNGAAGTFIEGPDVNVHVTDDTFTLPSTWSGGTPQTIDINFGTMATTTTTSGGTTSTTGFQSACHGTDYNGVHVWYFPRLVCVNKKNYDYGSFRNVYPRNCIYTGYMTMQATIV